MKALSFTRLPHLRRRSAALACASALLLPALSAHAQYVLQPDELTPSGSPGDSKDAKVYAPVPGPLSSNLDAYEAGTGANMISYIAFDLSSIPLTSAQVPSSILDLYARKNAGLASGMATIDGPVTVQLRLVTSAWTETGITFATQPSVGAVVATQVIAVGGQFYPFDVTSAVKGWLDNPGSNNGLQLTVTTPAGEAFFYASGENTLAENIHPNSQDPRLTVVPEPSTTAALALFAGAGLVALVSSRRSVRRI